ncbi:hypothetical protein QFZ79_000814 [Arthrobacter sp. V4I6]|uniref:hypothetical protein n=1 Tax=unclassified Arthrobacter TaxID=235627 RepID=UPI0027825891|nr:MULTISPECIES: hypothetical protein [unclassified Arthrobacter]MDQ0823071.1 hypothetical protein [Arthrobacter sp. V1I7]MDQ0852703.1 hypothetical protein [Arthrobacter sp. V4I6]
MNHQLRVLVRVDVDPGHVTFEVTGCLTQADFPALQHILRRTGRLESGSEVRVDLHGASHLDPAMLLQLRSIAAASEGPAGAEQFRVTLDEPAELPICLLHVGSDREILADLDGELATSPLDSGIGGVLDGTQGGPLGSGFDETSGPFPSELSTANGLELADCFEGTLDPAATVRALSDAALGQLADAVYRRLDTSSPSFGAHTWYELAAEELQNRHLAAADDPAEDELGAGQSPPDGGVFLA